MYSTCSVCLGYQRGYVINCEALGGSIRFADSDSVSGGRAILKDHVGASLATAAWQHAEEACCASD